MCARGLPACVHPGKVVVGDNHMGLPRWGSVVKNPANAVGIRDMGLIPASGRSAGRKKDSCLRNPTGGSLAGQGPWGCKESDTTEPLSGNYVSGFLSLYSHFSVNIYHGLDRPQLAFSGASPVGLGFYLVCPDPGAHSAQLQALRTPRQK